MHKCKKEILCATGEITAKADFKIDLPRQGPLRENELIDEVDGVYCDGVRSTYQRRKVILFGQKLQVYMPKSRT